MFYKQSATTQRWELDWNQLQDLYKDSDKDRVIKSTICSSNERENVYFFEHV